MAESVKEIIKLFLDRGYLINPDFIGKSDLGVEVFEKYLQKNETGELLVFNETMLNSLVERKKEIEERTLITETKNEDDCSVNIVKSYNKKQKKIEIQDFVLHYQKRYELLKKILQSRGDLIAPLSISRILSKRNREKVSTIGMVYEKNITKNNNIILNVEDNTGSISVLINNSKAELFKKAKDIVLDEVIGLRGVNGDKIVFADEIFFPDIPLNDGIKTSPIENYLAIISDVHVGSSLFLENDFLKFINWLNGKTGSKEQKEIAKKVKYLFIVGDLVDGVGIFPNQEYEQNLPDIYSQYKKSAELLGQIRKDLKIIICPGNHDAVRLAEPQPVLDPEIAKPVYELENVVMVSNPAVVNIEKSEGFPGFDVLLYHGYSYDDYSANVESIRFSGATISDRTNMVMKFLLQKRHLAPTHGSTLFIPDPDEDDLVIDSVPDFFVSGHIHKANITQYGKVTKISGGCWESITPFQIKTGHSPEPGKVPIVNLKTRATKILKFLD
jgi:DNA polymerase II small subunit